MINYSDKKERKLIVRSFAFIGSITTLIMACFAFADNDTLLFLALLMSSLLFISPWFIKRHDYVGAWIVLYTLYSLMLFLVFTGGSHGTGPIWIYIVSPVTFFIRGLRKGVVDISLFILAVIFTFVFAGCFDGYVYDSEQLLLRIVLSFIIVALLSGLYEYFRESYSQKLIQLAKNNEVLATTDPLTNLPNRRYTVERLYDEKSLSDKSNTSLSIMIFDVDDFKKINDQFGHQVGDCALIHLADTFRRFATENDIFCRWGGEEFLCVLPQTKADDAIVLAKQIQQDLLTHPVSINEQSFTLFVSVGVTEISQGDSIDSAIKQADESLYLAKTSGKNKVCSV
ncbi:GGDEF domain-containing protein [Pseudoalteromonas shioyasakiensis]|uniref:GGDEF domain-containing protein n=1 Tax=Pseudoalteromonas shioyasakiensis TaxID=1190813 RepID=UPI00211744D1|nr:GGDEF domain-containing protein [Pseudoalteromonas shioyasakiensis]MCQ8876827.1 GGDEF domain-containing protein [Pseudoalteromonas shioyasakiensis]